MLRSVTPLIFSRFILFIFFPLSRSYILTIKIEKYVFRTACKHSCLTLAYQQLLSAILLIFLAFCNVRFRLFIHNDPYTIGLLQKNKRLPVICKHRLYIVYSRRFKLPAYHLLKYISIIAPMRHTKLHTALRCISYRHNELISCFVFCHSVKIYCNYPHIFPFKKGNDI